MRWLSQGSALSRFYSLRQEIGEFLAEKGQPMRELSDPMWLADLGFLVDITKHLNVLNTSLQGPDAVISQLARNHDQIPTEQCQCAYEAVRIRYFISG